MSDLISRQAAIRWVKTECNPYGNPTLDFESRFVKGRLKFGGVDQSAPFPSMVVIFRGPGM